MCEREILREKHYIKGGDLYFHIFHKTVSYHVVSIQTQGKMFCLALDVFVEDVISYRHVSTMSHVLLHKLSNNDEVFLFKSHSRLVLNMNTIVCLVLAKQKKK